MKKNLLLFVIVLCAQSTMAQKNYWKPLNEYQAIKMNKGMQLFDAKGFVPAVYKLFQLNEDAITQAIKQAPMEGRNALAKSKTIIPVPVGNGRIEMFRIVEAPVMMPKLQAKYPGIRSYAGQSIDNPSNTIRFDITPIGLHATIGNVNGKKIYINPINKDAGLYLVNERSDKDKAPGGLFTCSTDDSILKEEGTDANKTAFVGNSDDGKLHTYRLALCVTGKWSRGIMTGSEVTTEDSMNTVMSAITGYLVRVNEVYERDLAIRLVYVDNEDTLVFLNPDTDPFGSLNSNCQKTCDDRIGDANYDVGHVIDKGANNGNAGCINCVCKTGSKGSGMTQYSNVGTAQLVDYFIIDYWTHEMGHQVGANHTFTHSNESTNAQIEPGSGSTIMGYAGITGNTDVQDHSDDLFACASIAQISNSWKSSLQGGKCAVMDATGNNAPVVNAGSDYVIPIQTAFVLTGSATDPDAGDVLSYVWEQTDVRETPGFSAIPKATNTKGPMFRTYNYSTSVSRYFPQLSDILLGSDATKFEVLPAVSRDLNFRFTARDNHPGGGCNKSDDILIKIDGTSGPFKLISPNTTVNWNDGETYTVTWNVANTNVAPVSCTQINILLSTDGGNTFPYLLKQNTDNDGSEDITIPDLQSATNTARIKIQSVGNIFFDISDKDFSIANALPVSWLSFTAEKSGTRTALLNWSTANEINNNHFEIERSIDGIAYTKISSVAAGKNPNAVQQYSFTDNDIRMGTNYYRIRQVDNDGKFTYSKTASVTIDASGISWNIQPNPATSKTTIIFNDNFKTVDIKITDAGGRQVYTNKITNVNASQSLDIDVSSFAKGLYIVNIISDGKADIRKLSVQ